MNTANERTTPLDHGATRVYSAFGASPAGIGRSATAYAGELRDVGVDMYMLGERLYSPTLRRFIGPDVAAPFDEGGVNRYAYCSGDPINRIDPAGNAWLDWLAAGLGLIGAVAATVATGGVLGGVLAAAAAGSLTAAISTPAMVAVTTATALAAVSVTAEVGSIASLAAGKEGAASILGWVAAGTGMASAALASLPRSAAGAAQRLTGWNQARQARRTERNLSRMVYAHADDSDALVFTGRRLLTQMPEAPPPMNPGVSWVGSRNMRGGVNWVPDRPVVAEDVSDLMPHLRADQGPQQIHILLDTGRGASPAHRYTRSDFHWGRFVQEKRLMEFLSGRATNELSIEPAQDLGRGYFRAVRAVEAHVVHARIGSDRSYEGLLDGVSRRESI